MPSTSTAARRSRTTTSATPTRRVGDDAHGDDARRYLEQAIAAYRKALALNPRYAYAWNNLGTAYTSLAATPGADADGALAEAVAAYGKSSDANPKFILPWVNAAEALTARAHRALDRGADPTSDLAAAHRAVAGAEAINAGYYYIGVKRAQIAIAQAELARARKRPTEPALTAATEALAWARGHHPDDVAEISRATKPKSTCAAHNGRAPTAAIRASKSRRESRAPRRRSPSTSSPATRASFWPGCKSFTARCAEVDFEHGHRPQE